MALHDNLSLDMISVDKIPLLRVCIKEGIQRYKIEDITNGVMILTNIDNDADRMQFKLSKFKSQLTSDMSILNFDDIRRRLVDLSIEAELDLYQKELHM